jgi:hypothetical protein
MNSFNVDNVCESLVRQIAGDSLRTVIAKKTVVRSEQKEQILKKSLKFTNETNE